MTAETTLRELSEFTQNATHANVLMGAGGDEQEFVLQRLTLTNDLSGEFLQNALSLFEEDEKHSLRKYEPGYKPEAYELCYISLSDSNSELEIKVVKEVVDSMANLENAEIFREADEVIDSLRFYGVIVDDGNSQAIFFREFSPKKELTRSRWMPIMAQRGTYDRVRQKIFLFDEDIDCFSWKGYLFIKSVPAFQRIFGYFDALERQAEQTIGSVATRVPVSNQSEFTDACKANPLMLAKLAQIARAPYLPTVTMSDIKRTIVDFRLDVSIVVEQGVEKLVYDGSPSKRWLILKLLDDDYLGSSMTSTKYEANSKVRL